MFESSESDRRPMILYLRCGALFILVGILSSPMGMLLDLSCFFLRGCSGSLPVLRSSAKADHVTQNSQCGTKTPDELCVTVTSDTIRPFVVVTRPNGVVSSSSASSQKTLGTLDSFCNSERGHGDCSHTDRTCRQHHNLHRPSNVPPSSHQLVTFVPALR
jgi:hypothetical protein